MTFYIRKNGVISQTVSFAEWYQWLMESNHERRVALAEIRDVKVSTVFISEQVFVGYPESGKPLLFETKVFGGLLNGETERAVDEESAMVNHHKLMQRVLLYDTPLERKLRDRDRNG